MNITVINGSPRKGNSYQVTKKFIGEMKKHGDVSVKDYFLPQDMPDFCRGCFNCILKDEKFCPHAKYVQPILDSMLNSDALIFNTPVYVMSCSGGMKAFLDHFAYIFVVHRARPEMFHKKAFILSTTAGAGTGRAMKVIETSLRFWGINRIYKRGFTMHSLNWEKMKKNKKERYEKQIKNDAEKFYNAVASKKDLRPYLYTRLMFFIAKQLRKREADDSADKRYLKAHGWLNGNSPFNS